MISVIGYKEHEANIAFVVVLVTAPIIGAVISSKLSASFGGHSSPKTLPFAIGTGMINLILFAFIPLASSKRLLEVTMWVAFFVGGL